MIATCDVAAEAAARLLRRDVAGHQVKLLLGPEDVTMAAATQAVASEVGAARRHASSSPRTSRAALAGAGMSEVASLMVDMQLAMNKGWPFANVARTAESTTPTTLEAFLKALLLMSGFPGLRASAKGPACAAGRGGDYDGSPRRIWNGAIDRRPALIARCAGADDVAVAVRFARQQDLPVSVRGGGRTVAGRRLRGRPDDRPVAAQGGPRRPRGPRRPGRRGTVVGRARRRHPAARAGHHRGRSSATPGSAT